MGSHLGIINYNISKRLSIYLLSIKDMEVDFFKSRIVYLKILTFQSQFFSRVCIRFLEYIFIYMLSVPGVIPVYDCAGQEFVHVHCINC